MSSSTTAAVLAGRRAPPPWPMPGPTATRFSSRSMTTNRFLQKNFPFDAKTAFAPITLTSDVALVLAVHPSLPVHDVTELIAYAKTNELAYASAGIGTSHHILGELIKQKVGIDMVHVPYRGGAALMQDL